MAKDFKSLTLSDFMEFPIGIRDDGSATIIIDNEDGHSIGLPGYVGDPKKSDLDIREEAFEHYQQLLFRLTNPYSTFSLTNIKIDTRN